MKITTEDGKLFTLAGETQADQALLDALYVEHAVRVADFSSVRLPAGHYTVTAAQLEVDSRAPAALRAKSQSEVLSALGDLLRLGLAEAARDRHVAGAPADPHPQEALAARLEELKLVLESIGSQIGQLKAVSEEMVRTHRDLRSSAEASIPRSAA